MDFYFSKKWEVKVLITERFMFPSVTSYIISREEDNWNWYSGVVAVAAQGPHLTLEGEGGQCNILIFKFMNYESVESGVKRSWNIVTILNENERQDKTTQDCPLYEYLVDPWMLIPGLPSPLKN